MARRVLADFDAGVDYRLGRRSDVAAADRAILIDDAYRRVAAEFAHPEIETTTTETLASGSDTISLSVSDFWFARIIRNATDGYTLDQGDLFVIENTVKPTGNPRQFYWWGGAFYTDAKPDSNKSIKIWYLKQLTELSAGQSSILNRVFDPIIEMYAAMLGFQRIRDFAQAHIQEVEANNYVADMKLARYETEKMPGRTGLRPRLIR